MDFHLEYLSSRYSINAEELRCLARALGYPTRILTTLFQVSESENIPLSKINIVMDQEQFQQRLNQTFNIYPADWNRHAILTSILLLSYRSITFGNLNLARCIFNFYEKSDGWGIVLNKLHLLQYLKMCNRIISPLKLTHRIKHMHSRLYYPNRLQLWEFLELIVWSEVFESMTDNNSDQFNTEKENDLYQLSSDDISMVYTELKCFELENTRYVKEELTFSKGNFSRVIRIIRRPLNYHRESSRRKMLHRQTAALSADINRSNQQLRVTSASRFKYSKPVCLLKNQNENQIKNKFHDSQRQIDILTKPVSHRPTATIRPKTAPIVSREDIEMYKQKVENCEIEIKTLDSKYDEKLHLDMEYLRPGFWQRWNNRPRPHTSSLTHVDMINVRKPSAEYLKNLSKPRSGTCSPLHNRCFIDL